MDEQDNLDDLDDKEDMGAWRSIRFFVLVILGLTAVGVLFFAVG